ncbi:YhjD/YihY/BrkB family envelope integrity protein [soil metagenome]
MRKRIISLYTVIKEYALTLSDKFDDDQVWMMSSAIAFNTLLCVIPFFLILLTIIGVYLNTPSALDSLNSYLNSLIPLPPQFKDKFILELLDRTKELSTNTLLSGIIATVAMIWTVSGLFSSFREVMYKIYGIKHDVHFLFLKLRDLILVIVSVLLFFISVMLTSGYQVLVLYSHGVFGKIIQLNFLYTLIPMVAAYVITFSLFFILYSRIPYRKMPMKVSLFASAFGALFFEILKYLFSIYLLKFADYSKIYGAYAAIVVFILWIYYISVIFVVGAELGSIFSKRNKITI